MIGRATPGVLVALALLGLVALSASARAEERRASCSTRPASSLVVNVKDTGAKGDGRTNDTAAIQAAIDKVGGTRGTVFVPDGTYVVDALEGKHLLLRSKMTLKLSAGAILKAIPNGADNYYVLAISGVSDVAVTGGTLEGERLHHAGQTGESGMGIIIDKDATHITISRVLAKEMWGDGFFVETARDVIFCSVIADHNRRQGLSIIEADGVTVVDSTFSNSRGTRPNAGIDLEPDRETRKITNVHIDRSTFANNAGPDILVAGRKGVSLIANVNITHNVFKDPMPIKIEYAPEVLDSAICGNRTISKPIASDTSPGYTDPIPIVVPQKGCEDSPMKFRR